MSIAPRTHPGQILCVYRPAFTLTPEVCWQPPGRTLAEAAAAMRPALPPEFAGQGVICVNGHPIPRWAWGQVRTRPSTAEVPIELTFHLAPLGGGDNGGKQVFALLASLAVSLAAGWVIGGGLATKFGLSTFAADTLAARLAGAGVQLIGSLLVSALVPPPVSRNSGNTGSPRNEGNASVEGNVLAANGAIPRVLGERKIFPPLALEPFTYFSGADEIVEAVFALAGPHRLLDVRVGSASAADLRGCDIETREGWPGDLPLTLIRRQTRTESVQAELRGHTVDGSDGDSLDTSVDVALALPQPAIVATRDAPEEHQLQLILPQGLSYQGSETTRLRMPIRLRMRPRGTETWRNLPELHFQAATPRQLRATIRLIWSSDPVTPEAASQEGWVEARRVCPDQTAAPAGGGWTADPAFGTTGDVWLNANNLGSTGVTGVALDRYEARILLDPADWAPGRWEIEIVRGAAFNATSYTSASYQVSGSVWALFGYRAPGAPVIVRSRDGLTDTLLLLRSVSIWNETPVVTGDLALIAMRARNRQLDAVSVLAGGYVPDWDGGDWRAWAVTDNPAPHLRDIYAGMLNADPLPASSVWTANLLDWRAHCIAMGYRVNAVIEGQSAEAAADIVAACGYARPYMGDLWGVAMDRDRSAEAPVQLFNARNSADFGWRRAMPRMPDGLRVNFRDAALDYEARQITVLRTGGSYGGILEQVDYEGPVTEAEARTRALYDLAQPELRGTDYSLRVPAEALVCRRGSLVAVSHDTLASHGGSARLVDYTLNDAGEVGEIELDGEVTLVTRPGFDAIADFGAVEDVGLIGARSGAMIRRATGSLTVHSVAGDGATTSLVLDPAIDPSGIEEDVLISVGRAEAETLRLIVKDIAPAEDFKATLTLTDEAQELWA